MQLNWSKIKGIVFNVLFIIVFLFFISIWEWYGVLGYFIFLVAFGLYRTWVFRDNVLQVMRYIETMIYGKPLDKELWKKGEKPKRRVKFVLWKSKKKKTKKKKSKQKSLKS